MIKQFTFFRKQIHGRGMLSHMSGTIRIAVAIRNLLLLFIMLTLAALVKGQDPIDLKLSVLPPYNTSKILNYFDTPYKMILTIRNTTLSTIDAYIDVKITDNAGITVSSDRKYWKKLTLAAGETFKLNQTNYDKIINTDHLVYKGITKDQIAQGIIPENDYTICIAAYDLKNSLLSAEEPGGCVTIPINAVSPPEIILPGCNENIQATVPQNILFSWSMPVGAPPTTKYTLKIVEFLSNQVPIVAIKRNLVIFEKSINVTTYLFSNADPVLTPGKTYAFAVKATEPDGRINFRNEGLSEVCSFSYMDSKIPGDLCKDFLKVILTKNPSGGACCYDLSVSNLYKGGKAGAPWSFSIGIDHASILTISDSIPANWVRTPSRLGESDDKMGKTGQRTSVKSTKKITWNAKSGEIPGGTTKLDKICFGDITGDSVYLKYTWRDSRKQIICLDSILLDCRQPAQCCLYYVLFTNERLFSRWGDIKNLTNFDRIVIKPLGGADIIGYDGIIDNDFVDANEVVWTQTNDALFNEITFTYMKGYIPVNNHGECLNLVPGFQIDNVTSTAKLQVSWYSGTVLRAQQEIRLQPCIPGSDTSDTYIENTNWRNFTQKTIGARLGVNSFAVPLNPGCEGVHEIMTTADDCPNAITGTVNCINSGDEIKIKLHPKNEPTGYTYSWDVEHENSSGTNTVTNTGTGNNFEYAIPGTSYGKNVISATLTEKAPSKPDCNYVWDTTVYVPRLDIHYKYTTTTNIGGVCPFIVVFWLSLSNTSLKDVTEYTWNIDNAPHTTTVRTYIATIYDEGQHTLQLSVKDKHGCVFKKDTTFTLSYDCIPEFDYWYEWCYKIETSCSTTIKVHFINNSKGGQCPEYTWKFGDNTNKDFTSDPTHDYTVENCFNNQFEVELSMKDIVGSCDKTITKTINIEAFNVGDGFTYVACPDGTVHYTAVKSVYEWNFVDVDHKDIDDNDPQKPIVTYYPQICDPRIYVARCTLYNPQTHARCEVAKEILVTRSCVHDTKRLGDYLGPETIDTKKFRMYWDFRMKFRKHKTNVKALTSIFRRYEIVGIVFYLPATKKYLQSVTASLEGKLFRKGLLCPCTIPDPYSQPEIKYNHYRVKTKIKAGYVYDVNACPTGDFFKSTHNATFQSGATWPGGPFEKLWNYVEKTQ